MFGDKTLPAEIFSESPGTWLSESEKVIREIPFENQVESRSRFVVRAPAVLKIMNSQNMEIRKHKAF